MPENPGDPAGRQIDLAVAAVPSISTRAEPDPLFMIASLVAVICGTLGTLALALHRCWAMPLLVASAPRKPVSTGW